MSEDRIKYNKRKFMYLVQDVGRSEKYLFGNIMAAVRWFDGNRPQSDCIAGQYDEIVRCIRSGSIYLIMYKGCQWDLVAVEVLGQSVRSSRKSKER
jgi:hypothetical protein